MPRISASALSLVVLLAIAALAQPGQGQSYPLAPPPGPQIYPHPFEDSNAGFKPIFDGETLHNWDGDPKYWHVEDHKLIGIITPETLLKQNSFIIWRGGTPANFELKAEFRITDHGNSGINYRSVQIPGTKWLLRGYQADIDGANKYTGQNYEERGRTFLAMRGTIAHVVTGKGATVIGSLGDADDLQAFIKPNDWNQYHLIVRGNVLIHILNGHVMSEVIDDDAPNRKFKGLIGVQVHVGPPMKVEYRNILLKTLPEPRPRALSLTLQDLAAEVTDPYVLLHPFAHGDVVASNSRCGRVHQAPKGKIPNE